MNLVYKALNAGGSIHPLIIPNEFPTNGTAQLNPSVYVDGGDILTTIRHCQYTIVHSEKGKFQHQWGPLTYLCPEDDLTLTTTNYLAKLNADLTIKDIRKVDTAIHDKKPIWEFVGLEDARLFRWDGKLYLCGVRRDTTTNGQGRMELSEVQYTSDGIKEVTRWRIPAPGLDNTYCEKNWMPILDMPFHFVKWSNPTEIVKVDPVKKTCEVVFQSDRVVEAPYEYRGGSHVIPFGDYRIAVAHVLTKFWRNPDGRKDATYRHCFIVWDKDWNVVRYGAPFSFMDAEIEFCCGMAEHDGNFLLSFGYQDNAAFVVKVPKRVIEGYVSGRN